MLSDIERIRESAFEGRGETADLAAGLASYCQHVSSSTRQESTEQDLVDTVRRVLNCDFVTSLAISKPQGANKFRASRVYPPFGESDFPLAALMRLLSTESDKQFMTRRRRWLLSANELDLLFVTDELNHLEQGFVVTLPVPAEGMLCVLFVAYEKAIAETERTIQFLDAMLAVSNLARRAAVSTSRDEHERVFRAKQEWQCSVDVLDQLICLVDRSGEVIRANRAVETLGLGDVTNMRGKFIWELLALLDHAVGENQEHPIVDWCRQARENWAAHWQSALDGDGVEWVVRSSTLDPVYCINVNLVNLGTPSSEGVEAHAVFVVDDISGFSTQRGEPERSPGTNALDSDSWANDAAASGWENEILSDELDAQEAERRRVALELHDGIGQMLTMMKLQCDCILEERGSPSPSVYPDQACRMEGLRESMVRAIEEVHRIGMNLRPPMLDDLGLGPTLRWFFRECSKSDPGFEISANIEIDEGLLSAELETEIFRITQEALNNISKHAHASTVQVDLQAKNSQIVLTIADDGEGFKPDDSNMSGAGIKNMLMRVTRRGGQFAMQAEPGEGVTLSARWQR